MPRALRIFLIILLVLAVFTLGKWLILDSLVQDRKSGRYRAADDVPGMTQ